MDTFLFNIPVLGISAWMYLDLVKIHFHNHCLVVRIDNHLLLYTNLYTTNKMHKHIIDHLLRLDFHTCRFLVEKLNPFKYAISFSCHDLPVFTSMLKQLFSCQTVRLQLGVSNNSVHGLGSCSFHLLDLYEIGYMSHTPIILRYPRSLPWKTKPRVFTGLIIRAQNPYQRYPYDFVELNFSIYPYKDFFSLCFDTMLHDRPDRMRPMTLVISNILDSIPFKNPHGAKKSLRHWKNFQELKIDHRDISIVHWKPGVFLKDLSKLLDIFSSYFIDYRFNLELDV